MVFGFNTNNTNIPLERTIYNKTVLTFYYVNKIIDRFIDEKLASNHYHCVNKSKSE